MTPFLYDFNWTLSVLPDSVSFNWALSSSRSCTFQLDSFCSFSILCISTGLSLIFSDSTHFNWLYFSLFFTFQLDFILFLISPGLCFSRFCIFHLDFICFSRFCTFSTKLPLFSWLRTVQKLDFLWFFDSVNFNWTLFLYVSLSQSQTSFIQKCILYKCARSP